MSSPPGIAKKRGSRSKVYVAPSGSWASITGPIRRPSPISDKHVTAAEIIHVECQCPGSGPCGQVLDGLLQIRAPTVTATISFHPGGWYAREYCSRTRLVRASSNGTRVSISCHPDVSSIEPPPPTQEVLYILFTYDQRKETEEWASGLMVVSSRTSPAVFERIGVAELNLDAGGLRSRMGIKTSTIV